MTKIFHIGIPKSGTTTIQSILENDERITLTRSNFFTTSSWWLGEDTSLEKGKVNIESNETLISGGFSKIKLHDVFDRISKKYPDAKIIVTIRRQEDAILSMYKYHIKYNFKGVKSLENWMYNTNLGMDYLSLCMYGNIARLLLLYFKRENIHFLCFEDLKSDQTKFFKKYYDILGLDYMSKVKEVVKNKTSLNDNQLYTLSKFNYFSLLKADSENIPTYKTLSSIERKMRFLLIEIFRFKSPKSFFQIENVSGYTNLMKDFKDSNDNLVKLGFIEASKLRMYNYI